MYLEKIDIKNFRSLKNLTVSLRSGLNVLVGRNNTGKTNLFYAIRHALGPSASRGESLWLTRDDFHIDAKTGTQATSMSVTLTFAELTEQERAHFYEIVEFDLSDLTASRAVLRFEASWPPHKRHASIKRWGGPETAEPPQAPAELLQSLPITFLPAVGPENPIRAGQPRSRRFPQASAVDASSAAALLVVRCLCSTDIRFAILGNMGSVTAAASGRI